MIRPAAIETRLLLAAGAFGAVLFVVVWLFDGVTRPGYDAVRLPVSALALGERGWVQIANFVVTGLLMAAFSLGVRRTLDEGRAAVWAPALLAAFAVGLIASGLFVMDPPADQSRGGSDVGGASWHGVAHDIAGLVVFSALPAAAFVMAGRFWASAGRNWLGVVSFVAGIVTLGLFVAFVIVDESDAGGAGLLQRLSIVVGWGWIGLVAVILLADAPEPFR